VTLPYTITALIFRPTALSRPNPGDWGLRGAVVAKPRTADRSHLFAWWAPPRTDEQPVVLIAHGRSANLSTRAAIAARLARDGFGVLMFDYHGYGASEGRASERHIAEDTLAAYDWLLA
jgi:alpha-beta hydrolase superfamily lysophospholipase